MSIRQVFTKQLTHPNRIDQNCTALLAELAVYSTPMKLCMLSADLVWPFVSLDSILVLAQRTSGQESLHSGKAR